MLKNAKLLIYFTAFAIILVVAVKILKPNDTKVTCYKCLAEGETFKLPYPDVEKVTYINNKNEEVTYLTNSFSLPIRYQYCGSLDTFPYRYCKGFAQVGLRTHRDSVAFILITQNTMDFDSVEVTVNRVIQVGKSSMGMYRGGLIAHNNKGTCTKLDSVTINKTLYRNVAKFEDELAPTDECSSFIYSTTIGILEYTIRKNNSEEVWTMKQ